MNLTPFRRFAIAFVLLQGLASTVQAQKAVPASQLAVDVLTLKSGKSIRGALIKADAGTISVAVSRMWLEKSAPDLYQKTIANETVLQTQVAEQLRDRLKKLLQTPAQDQRLVFFLKQELERVELQLTRKGPVELSQFLWLDLEQGTVTKIARATPDRLRIAIWAWNELLLNVESRDVHDLERDLKQRKIDPTAAPPDLSNRLAPQLQDEREWAARMAIVEYTFGKPLDFQGTGNVMVRIGTGQNGIDLAPVLSKVLQSQVDSLLKDLSGDSGPTNVSMKDNSWLKSATTEANELDNQGFRATRVDAKIEQHQAAVQTAFVARMPNGSWETVWSVRETQDSTKQRADIEAKIADDPQVSKVLQTVKSFGLGADDQIKQAIRFGAATMAAQQAADGKFFEFRDRYLKRLDGPPLTWPK